MLNANALQHMHNFLHDELYQFIPSTHQSSIFLSSLSIRLVQDRGYISHFQRVVSLCPLLLLSSWLTLQSLTSDWLNKDCLSLSTKQRYGLLKSDPEKSLRSDGLHSFKSVSVQWPHKQLGCSIPQQISSLVVSYSTSRGCSQILSCCTLFIETTCEIYLFL